MPSLMKEATRCMKKRGITRQGMRLILKIPLLHQVSPSKQRILQPTHRLPFLKYVALSKATLTKIYEKDRPAYFMFPYIFVCNNNSTDNHTCQQATAHSMAANKGWL